MERIYPPENIRASELLSLNEYFLQYEDICGLGKTNPKMEKTTDGYFYKILKNMEVPLDDVQIIKELEEKCSIDHLTCENDSPDAPAKIPDCIRSRTTVETVYPISDASRSLEVIKSKETFEAQRSYFELCFSNKTWYRSPIVTPREAVRHNMNPGSDYVINVIVYRPFAISFGQGNSMDKLRFGFEMEVLGRNTLTQLVDVFMCPTNLGLLKEVENTKADLEILGNSKECYPSSCFFIEGTFYSDFRSPNAIDYSSNIIPWAKDKGIGNFKSESMQSVTINSLKFRLGYPYVYMHQGDCEHIIVFSDAHLLKETDCLNSKKYPRISEINRNNNVLCFICGSSHANWICTECDRFPQSKTFLCTECCNSYNYIGDKKIGNFHLFPFYNMCL